MMTTGAVRLGGRLTVPDGATGVVVFAHGSGSSRHSPRNRFAADGLHRAGSKTPSAPWGDVHGGWCRRTPERPQPRTGERGQFLTR
jgi:predicted alpha/beta-hydrolase family hydrolase